MDFEAVVTTSREDRDRDILEAGGAEVDPKSPLLWQHIPFEPIGKLVQVTKQNSKRVEARFAIADLPLGHDAATLIELEALRISHGFRPLEWEVRETDDEEDSWRRGFHIKRFEIMEVSVVSIPANTDAVILANDRHKLHHPLSRAWADRLRRSLPASVVGGWDGGDATGGLPYAVSISKHGVSITPLPPAGKDQEPPADEGKSADHGCGCRTSPEGAGNGEAVERLQTLFEDARKRFLDLVKGDDARPKVSKRNLAKLHEVQALLADLQARLEKTDFDGKAGTAAVLKRAVDVMAEVVTDLAGSQEEERTTNGVVKELIARLPADKGLDRGTLLALKEATAAAEESLLERDLLALLG
jgi:HK97 family phage prohead protease